MYQIFNLKFNNIELPLSKKIHDYEGNIFTLIIGKNGLGKSRLLTSIIYNYTDEKKINFYNRKSNTDTISDINTEIKPNKIIAHTNSQFNRFPRTYYFDKNTFYILVGSTTSNSSIFQDILFKKNINQESISKVLKYLNYSPKLIVKPYFKTGTISSGYLQINLDRYKEYFKKVGVDINKQANNQNKNIKKFINILQLIREKKTKEIIYEDFLSLYKLFVLHKIHLTNLEVHCNIETNSYEYKGIDFEDFKILEKFNILNLDEIIFEKRTTDGIFNYVYFTDLSSGEKSIIYTLLGISSVIEDNSLICIDEPEISLHPEWQEEIITKLQEAFNFRKGCHFIIATHSPQVVSGLKSQSGFILDLENRELHCSSEYSFKSADHQLAKIFNAPGHNNEYLIRIALVLISKLAKQEVLNEIENENYIFLKNIKNSLPIDDSVSFLIDQLISMDSI